jgi:hypothetical protein
MNNSFIAIQNVSLEIETPADFKPNLRKRESELLSIIKAINTIIETDEWKLLQDKVWNGIVEVLKRQRDSEVEKQPINGPRVHSLNGQLVWAKKFSNLADLASIYKLELSSIRKELNVKGS